MSLYNAVHGINEAAGSVLAILNLSVNDVPRFRDAWIDNNHSEPRLVVYTRTGGGNRPWYDNAESRRRQVATEDEVGKGPWNDELRQHPMFIEDKDGDFDSTYAEFHFRVPEPVKAFIALAIEEGFAKSETPGEAWQRVIAEIKSGNMTSDTAILVDKLRKQFGEIMEFVKRDV